MMKTRCFFIFCLISTSLLFFVSLPPSIHGVESGTLPKLYAKVEALKISRDGYVLAGELTEPQKEAARKNPLKSSTPGTYKFTDNRLTIVADGKTDRILLIMESFDDAVQQTVRDLVGSLFMEYDEPTISAHDKIVYWAYGTKGKYSALEFEAAKEEKKQLTIIATVKLQSELEIMEKSTSGDERTGSVYYIIASEPLLKHFHANAVVK